MKIKTSKTMCNLLKKHFKNSYCVEKIELLEMNYDQYSWLVCDSFNQYEYDYNSRTGKLNVLKIIYKDSMQSLSKYITTLDMVKEVKENNVKTADDFLKVMENLVNI